MSVEVVIDDYSAPLGSFKLKIKGEEYLVRVMRPSTDVSVNELQLSLVRNREMLNESYQAMLETCRDDFFKRVDKKKVDYFSPTQNALVARANIDLLIPLINVKGGVAAYQGKKEGLPIEKHIEKLRDKAVKKIREEDQSIRIGGFLLVMTAVALTTVILLWFF
ncbi:MAG: hypothetical protein V3U71_07795 [Cocleimonas sp.]